MKGSVPRVHLHRGAVPLGVVPVEGRQDPSALVSLGPHDGAWGHLLRSRCLGVLLSDSCGAGSLGTLECSVSLSFGHARIDSTERVDDFLDGTILVELRTLGFDGCVGGIPGEGGQTTIAVSLILQVDDLLELFHWATIRKVDPEDLHLHRGTDVWLLGVVPRSTEEVLADLLVELLADQLTVFGLEGVERRGLGWALLVGIADDDTVQVGVGRVFEFVVAPVVARQQGLALALHRRREVLVQEPEPWLVGVTTDVEAHLGGALGVISAVVVGADVPLAVAIDEVARPGLVDEELGVDDHLDVLVVRVEPGHELRSTGVTDGVVRIDVPEALAGGYSPDLSIVFDLHLAATRGQLLDEGAVFLVVDAGVVLRRREDVLVVPEASREEPGHQHQGHDGPDN